MRRSLARLGVSSLDLVQLHWENLDQQGAEVGVRFGPGWLLMACCRPNVNGQAHGEARRCVIPAYEMTHIK